MKDFADNNLKFEENGRKLFKLVENTVGKGELLLFPQCFRKACFPGASKGVIVWEWVKFYLHVLDVDMNALLMKGQEYHQEIDKGVSAISRLHQDLKM